MKINSQFSYQTNFSTETLPNYSNNFKFVKNGIPIIPYCIVITTINQNGQTDTLKKLSYPLWFSGGLRQNLICNSSFIFFFGKNTWVYKSQKNEILIILKYWQCSQKDYPRLLRPFGVWLTLIECRTSFSNKWLVLFCNTIKRTCISCGWMHICMYHWMIVGPFGYIVERNCMLWLWSCFQKALHINVNICISILH